MNTELLTSSNVPNPYLCCTMNHCWWWSLRNFLTESKKSLIHSNYSNGIGNCPSSWCYMHSLSVFYIDKKEGSNANLSIFCIVHHTLHKKEGKDLQIYLYPRIKLQNIKINSFASLMWCFGSFFLALMDKYFGFSYKNECQIVIQNPNVSPQFILVLLLLYIHFSMNLFQYLKSAILKLVSDLAVKKIQMLLFAMRIRLAWTHQQRELHYYEHQNKKIMQIYFDI